MTKQKPSISHTKFLKVQKQKKWLILLAQVFLLFGFIALWEALTYFKILDSFIFSSPSRIVKTVVLLYESGELRELRK